MAAMNSRTLHELKTCQERAALSVIRKVGDATDYRAMLARMIHRSYTSLPLIVMEETRSGISHREWHEGSRS